jgi:phosphohistidine phosphatase
VKGVNAVKLILVRHAQAADLGEAGSLTDFDRPLTDLGWQQAAALANALKKQGMQPDAVVTSPLVRAVQTAEPLAAELTPGKPPVVSERLAMGELKPKKLSKSLSEMGGAVLVLVGHQPDMGEYAAWLLDAEDENIKFEKGAAACIAIDGDIEAGGGLLEWLIPPGWFMPS